jgi:hypothetical protein
VTLPKDVPSLSLMAYVGSCGGAAATKYESPRDAGPYSTFSLH